jgi:hypothetical protein
MKAKQTWLVALIAVVVSFESVANSHWTNIVETDAHWTSNVEGFYLLNSNGQSVWNTNTDQFWKGYWSERTWTEDTNGWRSQISSWTNSHYGTVSVEAGSITMNSGMEYYRTPNHKFPKFELFDTNGVVIPAKRGMSLEDEFPQKLSTHDYPGWGERIMVDGHSYRIHFYSNGPPPALNVCELNKAYSIKSEGDYTLTVCPVLYKLEANGTNLDRVDLPCVTAKIHLKPSQ